jgi:hypothetical protein
MSVIMFSIKAIHIGIEQLTDLFKENFLIRWILKQIIYLF